MGAPSSTAAEMIARFRSSAPRPRANRREGTDASAGEGGEEHAKQTFWWLEESGEESAERARARAGTSTGGHVSSEGGADVAAEGDADVSLNASVAYTDESSSDALAALLNDSAPASVAAVLAGADPARSLLESAMRRRGAGGTGTENKGPGASAGAANSDAVDAAASGDRDELLGISALSASILDVTASSGAEDGDSTRASLDLSLLSALQETRHPRSEEEEIAEHDTLAEAERLLDEWRHRRMLAERDVAAITAAAEAARLTAVAEGHVHLRTYTGIEETLREPRVASTVAPAVAPATARGLAFEHAQSGVERPPELDVRAFVAAAERDARSMVAKEAADALADALARHGLASTPAPTPMPALENAQADDRAHDHTGEQEHGCVDHHRQDGKDEQQQHSRQQQHAEKRACEQEESDRPSEGSVQADGAVPEPAPAPESEPVAGAADLACIGDESQPACLSPERRESPVSLRSSSCPPSASATAASDGPSGSRSQPLSPPAPPTTHTGARGTLFMGRPRHAVPRIDLDATGEAGESGSEESGAPPSSSSSAGVAEHVLQPALAEVVGGALFDNSAGTPGDAPSSLDAMLNMWASFDAVSGGKDPAQHLQVQSGEEEELHEPPAQQSEGDEVTPPSDSATASADTGADLLSAPPVPTVIPDEEVRELLTKGAPCTAAARDRGDTDAPRASVSQTELSLTFSEGGLSSLCDGSEVRQSRAAHDALADAKDPVVVMLCERIAEGETELAALKRRLRALREDGC